MSTELRNLVYDNVRGLDIHAFSVLQAIAHFADGDLRCKQSPDDIAERSMVKTRSLPPIFERLEKLGFIQEVVKGGGRNNPSTFLVILERIYPETYAPNVGLEEKHTLPTYETPLNLRSQTPFPSVGLGRTIETGARARLEGEDLLHKSSLDGWKVIEPVSSSAIQPTQEKISIQNFEITEDQKLVTDAICEVTGRNRNDLSPRDFDGLVSSLLKIEQSESGATGAERAEQVRRRFTAPNFDLPNPPSPEQVGRWWDRSGVKLKHRETLKANPSATQYGGRGQPKNEEEAQFMRELEQHRAQFNGARSGQMPR